MSRYTQGIGDPGLRWDAGTGAWSAKGLATGCAPQRARPSISPPMWAHAPPSMEGGAPGYTRGIAQHGTQWTIQRAIANLKTAPRHGIRSSARILAMCARATSGSAGRDGAGSAAVGAVGAGGAFDAAQALKSPRNARWMRAKR